MTVLLFALAAALPARAQISFTITDLGTLGGTSSTAYAITADGQIVGESYLAGDAVSRAFSYTLAGGMVEIGGLGGNRAVAYAVNASGQIVGEATPASGVGSHAFSYTPAGGMVDLGTLGGEYSLATGINAAGEIVGKSNGDGAYRAVRFVPGGTPIDLGTLGGNHSNATAINDSRQIVGGANTEDGATQVFSLTTGMVNLGSLGGADATALAVNASGQIVGYSSITGESEKHAFSYTVAGGMVDLGTLGGIEAYARAVNASGQIVGISYLPNFQEHAFYSTGGVMYDLNDLVLNRGGWTLTGAYGINDSQQIVGYGSINGENHAFLLTAVPEPSTYAMFAGLGALGFALARRRSSRPSNQDRASATI